MMMCKCKHKQTNRKDSHRFSSTYVGSAAVALIFVIFNLVGAGIVAVDECCYYYISFISSTYEEHDE